MPRSSLSEQRIRYLQLVAGLTKHRDTLAHASIHDVDALKATLQAQVAAIDDAATKLAVYRTSVLRLRGDAGLDFRLVGVAGFDNAFRQAVRGEEQAHPREAAHDGKEAKEEDQGLTGPLGAVTPG